VGKPGEAGEKKNPAPKSARGFLKDLENPGGSLAVFYVEQVTLNRHDWMSNKTQGILSHNQL
jgi:hypothetical protein